MPIVFWPTSVKQTQAFQVGLDKLVQLKRIPSGLPMKPPLPIYNVGLRDVVMNTGLNTAGKLVSWRYFAGGDSEATAVSGDVDLSATPRLTSLVYGKAVLHALEAVEALENSPDLQNVQYEPRVLRVPGLLLECLWLSPMQPLGTEVGWVVPYSTLIKTFNPKEQADTFHQKLRPWAEKALAKGRLPNQTRPQ